MTDGVRALVHDHAEINRRVRALAASIRTLSHEPEESSAHGLELPLRELREQLFLHFAREEEGLFPYVTEVAPDLEAQAHEMAVAHDTICGALARMVHLASTRSPMTLLVPVFERFEMSYGEHAQSEAGLLNALEARLDPAQRDRLASLIESL